MKKLKLLKSLIFISNLAIQPDLNLKKGLVDILNLNDYKQATTSPSKFIERNKEILDYCYLFIKIKDFSWDLLVKNLYENFDFQKVKSFLDDFRVFAIKNYFSNPYVLSDLSLLENSDQKNGNIGNEKDKAILNSLIDGQKRFIR